MEKSYITRQQIGAVFDGVDRWVKDDWEAFGIDYDEIAHRGIGGK